MADRYQQLINTPIGKIVSKQIGLPAPVKLERYERGQPVVALGQTLNLSFSLEASGELAPGGRWASDTAEPIKGYRLTKRGTRNDER